MKSTGSAAIPCRFVRLDVGWACLADRTLCFTHPPFAKPPDCEDAPTPQHLQHANGRTGRRHTHPKITQTSLIWLGQQTSDAALSPVACAVLVATHVLISSV